jgi:hypothetical protein
VSHETHSDEQLPATLEDDVEPTVLSYREFRRREHLQAWYRRRREQELTGAAYPSARRTHLNGAPPA